MAAALRPTDPALLHYRSGAFYWPGPPRWPASTPLRDVLLGLVGSADEPIAGGRHKVFGHAGLAVIPQTSTIASHLPRAVGVALAIGRARKLGWARPVARRRDHGHQLRRRLGQPLHRRRRDQRRLPGGLPGLPMPVLFVCEDNGIGISVPTPDGWIEAAYRGRHGTALLRRRRRRPVAVYDTARAPRITCGPAGGPRSCTCGSCGSWPTPAPTPRRPTERPGEIAADYERDPLVGTAGCWSASAWKPRARCCDVTSSIRARVRALAEQAVAHRRLSSRPRRSSPRWRRAVPARSPSAPPAPRRVGRDRAFGGKLPEDAGPADTRGQHQPGPRSTPPSLPAACAYSARTWRARAACTA